MRTRIPLRRKFEIGIFILDNPNKTWREIAAEFGLNVSTFTGIARSINISRKHGHAKKYNHAKIIDRLNAGLSLRSVGREFHLTGERIRQIANKHGVATKAVCIECGAGTNRRFAICTQCKHKSIKHICRGCRAEFRRDSRDLYCPACRYQTFTCDGCGGSFTVKRAGPYCRRGKHHFCNRKCLGHWAGVNHGFGPQWRKRRAAA